MAHHLSPTDLARRLGIERRDVIVNCLASGVPIVHGRIDRTLYESAVRERPDRPAGETVGA